MATKTATKTKRLCGATPCSNCPWLAEFRGDADYLRPGRRADAILHAEGGFACHKTTDGEFDDETGDYTRGGGEVECAGFALVMLRSDRNPPGVLKIAERMGSFDSKAFLAANVNVELWTYAEAAFETMGEDEGDHCSVTGTYCEAPAGQMLGGNVVTLPGVIGLPECSECGEPVCESCLEGTDVCPNCLDEFEDFDHETI